MIDSTAVSNVGGVINQIVNIANAIIIIATAIGSFVVGHSHGVSVENKRNGNGNGGGNGTRPPRTSPPGYSV